MSEHCERCGTSIEGRPVLFGAAASAVLLVATGGTAPVGPLCKDCAAFCSLYLLLAVAALVVGVVVGVLVVI